jgi:DNA-binding CsgD family transcriptional regulator
MTRTASTRLGDVSAMARVVQAMPPTSDDPVQQKRKMVADFCRLVGADYSLPPTRNYPGLSPRQVQTLDRLLAGDSEKQIALHLGISQHTIHVYIKAIYRRFDVCSRGELFAKFVQ